VRIAMLHWGFPPIIGGVETHLVFLMPQLVRMGNEVSLLTGSADGLPEHFVFKGVDVYRSKFYDLNWLFKSNFQEVDDNVYDITLDFLNKSKPDVIHAHNMHYFSRYHVQVLENYAVNHRIPLVLTAHNVWKDKLFLDLTCKVAWHRVIAISHYIKRELMAVGVPREKIEVVHHGIDNRMFSPGKPSSRIFRAHKELKGRRRVVFSPARMGISKGCDVVIEAFRLVRERFPDALLLMSGSGNIIDWGLTQNKDIAYFVSLIKHLELEDCVYINTFSLDKEMPELYRLAGVVVYPSFAEEPFGLAMLEAMATAKPIIVTESGAMPEIIEDDVNGYVIPKNNHEVLAERIIGLFSNPEVAQRLGRTGRQQVENMYTKEIYASNIFKVYEDAIRTYPKKTRLLKAKAGRKKVFSREGIRA
jgi:glycosyltransferase involved in cell wall biosynthesis